MGLLLDLARLMPPAGPETEEEENVSAATTYTRNESLLLAAYLRRWIRKHDCKVEPHHQFARP